MIFSNVRPKVKFLERSQRMNFVPKYLVISYISSTTTLNIISENLKNKNVVIINNFISPIINYFCFTIFT